MPVALIIGSQWGDEGKGKIIDSLAATSHLVIRFQGGNNAGHTVINDLGNFKMHLIPCGIFAPKVIACITNGVVLNLEVLVEEIEMLVAAGIDLDNRLIISPRCHLILPYHRLLDGLYEKAKGKGKVGTTGRGIGPVYADKVSYNGIRISDFMDKKQFRAKLSVQLSVKNKILQCLGEKPLSFAQIEKEMAPIRAKISQFVKEPYPIIHDALKNKKGILLEGAQAVFLDNDWGTYPYVTASTVVAGGVTAGAGIPPRALTDIIGVAKAYITRVGEGPFPTELLGATGEKIQTIGNEFGATTGRPRRCGWFDAELVRFAVELNGLTGIALTKLDVLDGFETIKICTGYEVGGKKVRYYDGDEVFLAKVKPIYKTMKGWRECTKGITKFEKLPKLAQVYVAEVEKQIGCKVSFISTGPKREELIKL